MLGTNPTCILIVGQGKNSAEYGVAPTRRALLMVLLFAGFRLQHSDENNGK